MTAEDLLRRLPRDRIVRLTLQEWTAIADGFPEIERHATGVAGDLLIVHAGSEIAAVEQPSPDERVMRYLGDEPGARAFVADRLAAYERMWDGCGCKVDYFA